MKKLQIRRITLRHLQPDTLVLVVGGKPQLSVEFGCVPSEARTGCPACDGIGPK